MNDDDLIANGGKKTSCPDGATCLPPGSINHHPTVVEIQEGDPVWGQSRSSSAR